MAINFMKIRNGVALGSATSDPASGANGDLYYNSTNNELRAFVNGGWTDLADISNSQTFTNKIIQFLRVNTAADASTTGSSATLAAFTTGVVQVTNASLSSLSEVPAGAAGQFLTISNKTGAAFVVKNQDTGSGTAANRIITGTGTNLSFANDSSITLYYDSVSSRWRIVGGSGSSSGSSNINYATNGTAETGTNDWVTYSDTQTVTITNASPGVFTVASTTGYFNGLVIAFTTSGSLPTGLTSGTTYYVTNLGTDGANKFRVSTSRGGADLNTSSAGSGTHTARPLNPVTLTSTSLTGLTFSQNTSSPLRGAADFKLLQSNTTVIAGQGVYLPFTIDSADKGRIIGVQLDFNADSNFSAADGITAPNSGGAGDSDLEWFIQDVTNSTFIPLIPQIITANGSNNSTFTATFQTASNSTSYRLAVHASKTSAAATGFTFKWDNLTISPQSVSNTSRTVIFSGNNTSNQAVTANVTNLTFTSLRDSHGAWTGTTYVVPTAGDYAFIASLGVTGTGNVNFFVYKNGSSVKKMVKNIVSAGNCTTGAALVQSCVPGDILSIRCDATDTVSGGAVGSQGEALLSIYRVSSGSSDNDTRVVDFLGNKTSNQAVTADVTDITFTALRDSHGAWNGSQYVVPVSGDYVAGGVLGVTSTNTDNFRIFVNSTLYKKAIGRTIGVANITSVGSTMVYGLKAGDTISIRCDATDTVTSGAAGTNSEGQFFVYRLSGPSAVLASDKIYLQYTNNGGTALTANVTNMDWTTKVTDSHSAWSGTVFTAPRAGWYNIQGSFQVTVGGQQDIYLYLNGTQKYLVTGNDASGGNRAICAGTYLNAGDLVSFRSDTNKTLNNTANNHWLSISSQG